MRATRWDMTLAARLLQWGAGGGEVARAVGCTPPEITRSKEKLLAMEVEPMTDAEAEQLGIRKKEEKMQPVSKVEAETKPEERAEKAAVPAPAAEDHKAKKKLMVQIDIGRGKAHLEAEDEQVLDTLIRMIVAMSGRT